MGPSWDRRLRAAVAGAAVATLSVASACQLFWSIGEIEYSPDGSAATNSGGDAGTDGDSGGSIDSALVVRGPPCKADDGTCVPSGGVSNGQVCTGGRFVNCGNPGSPCCPGAPGGTADFCVIGALCESGYCTALAITEPRNLGGPCGITFGLPENQLPSCTNGCCDWEKNRCVGYGTACTPGICRQDLGQFSCGCGGANQQCCADNKCIEPYTTCSDGLCKPCNQVGAPCCSDKDGRPSCLSGVSPVGDEATLVCAAGVCSRCGALDEPCCEGLTCSEGACDPNAKRCKEAPTCGDCGGPGEKCCAGACSAGACCDVEADICRLPGDACLNGLKCQSDGKCACGLQGHDCCPTATPCVEGGSPELVCHQQVCRACGYTNSPCCPGVTPCIQTKICDGGASCPLECEAGTCQ